MAKERLSKLQKWILEELYILIKKCGRNIVISRKEIMGRALEDGMFKIIKGKTEIYGTEWVRINRKSNEVILTRSIKKLYEKELIVCFTPHFMATNGLAPVMPKELVEAFYPLGKHILRSPENITFIQLDKKGKIKAKKLLNVNK